MKKRVLLNILIATMVITGCGAFETIAQEPTPIIEETGNEAKKPRAVTSENIIITDGSASLNSEEVLSDGNGISVDAGESRVLESTIDQLTEEFEK